MSPWTVHIVSWKRIYIKNEVLEHSIDEFFDDSAAIHALFFQSLLIEKDYLVLLPKVSVHAAVICVLELVASSHSDDQVLIYLLLQEKGTIVILFIQLYELFELLHPWLEGKNEGKLFQKHLDPLRSLAEQEILETVADIVVDKDFCIELFSPQCLFIKIAEQVDNSFEL